MKVVTNWRTSKSTYYFDQLGLEKLDKLELNHNKIEELVDFSFEGLTKLTSLSMDYNKIFYIQNRAFIGVDGKLGTHEGLIIIAFANDIINNPATTQYKIYSSPITNPVAGL